MLFATSLLIAAAFSVLCGKALRKHPASFYLTAAVLSMLHNIGQIAAAVIMMQSFGVIAYLPILLVTGSLAGAFTGLCAQLVLNRIKR